MKELSNEAKELLARAKPALKATPEQVERMRAGIAAKAAISGGAGASAAVLKLVLGIGAAIAVAVAVAIAVQSGQKHAPSHVTPEVSVAPSSPAVEASSAPVVVAVAPPTPTESAAPIPVVKPTATAPIASAAPIDDADSLAEESTLVRSAQQALRDGDAAKALTLADKHIARFPRGVLRTEAHVTRVMALCDLGRTDDAKLELAATTRVDPRSPALSRARSSCAAAP